MIEEARIDCPYCGEPVTVLLDWSGGDCSYIEDCEVCCRPIEFHLRVAADGGPGQFQARREDD